MFRHVLLTILVACLAFPAIAMPALHAQMGHGPQGMTAMPMVAGAMPALHHAAPASHRDDAMPGSAHECIGCMARYDGVALPAAPWTPVALTRCVAAAPQRVGAGSGPETPPPRC